MQSKLITILGFVTAIGLMSAGCSSSSSPGNTSTGGTTAPAGGVVATGGSSNGAGGTITGSGGVITATGGRTMPAMPDGGGFTRPDGGFTRPDAAQRITCGGVTCGRNQPYCLNDSICSQCQAATDCNQFAPVCDLTAGRCVQCAATTDCGANEICTNNRCEPSCASDLDCAPPDGGRFNYNTHCNTTTSLCVQCTEDSHCSTNSPYCETNTCRQCRTDDDCAGGTCGNNGRCNMPRPDGGGFNFGDGGFNPGGGFTPGAQN